MASAAVARIDKFARSLGFGGCAVALVKDDTVPEFLENVRRRYAAATGLAPKLYFRRATNGVEAVSSSDSKTPR